MREIAERQEKLMTVKEVASILKTTPDEIKTLLQKKWENLGSTLTPLQALFASYGIIIKSQKDVITAHEELAQNQENQITALEGLTTQQNHHIRILELMLFNHFPQNETTQTTRETYQENNKKGFVYLSTDKSGFYKIGRTKELSRRESALKCGNLGYKVIASVLVEDCVELETFLHLLFSSKQIEREWFELSDDDLDLLINYYGFIKGVTT